MKSRTTAALLAFFLGGLGVHQFYLGNTKKGFVYLLFFWTLIPAFMAIVDFTMILSTNRSVFDIMYNYKLLCLLQQPRQRMANGRYASSQAVETPLAIPAS